VTRRDIPNLISACRLLLVPPIVMLLLAERYFAALMLFLLAGISDGLDGFLAKRFDWRSDLGGFLDPLADKLLMVATVLALTAEGLIPLWLTAVIVLRDVVIVGGAVAYRLLIGRFQAEPSVVSKLNTAVLIILVLGVVAVHAFDWPLELWPLFLLTLFTSFVSGADYVVRWSRRARAARARGARQSS
jgi:cardiolipin synthase